MENLLKKGIVFEPADLQNIDWLAKLKMAGLNTLGLHSGGGVAHDVLENLGSFGEAPFQQKVAAAGLELEYEEHASQNLLPVTLFETHPEYFMQTSRSRVRVKGFNWCVTNSDARKAVRHAAAELARRLPSSTHCYYLWGCDSPNEWCHCSECSAYSPADQALLAANEIAAGVREVDPVGQVAYLAYYETLWAPRRVRPANNVFCEFAPYLRNMFTPICDTRCAVNLRHAKQLLDLLALFGPDRMQILEYWLDASLTGQRGDLHKNPFDKKVCEADVRFYTMLGIRKISTFGVRMDDAYLAKYTDRDFLDYAEILNLCN